MGEGEARFAHCVDDGGVGVWVAQAADCVGAVLVGHDDQDVAYVVGDVPSLVGHWCVFSSLNSGVVQLFLGDDRVHVFEFGAAGFGQEASGEDDGEDAESAVDPVGAGRRPGDEEWEE